MTQPAAPTVSVRFLDGNVHLCSMGEDGIVSVPGIGAFNVVDILATETGDRDAAQKTVDDYVKSRGVAEKTPAEADTKATT